MVTNTRKLSRIAQLCDARGLRQTDIVKATGESKQNVNKLWFGQTQLSKRWALRLEAVLKMPWTDIMKLEDGQGMVAVDGVQGLEPSTTLDELEVTTQAGSGMDDMPLDGEGGHLVVAKWQIPTSYLRTYASASGDVKIIRVAGDSMEPDYPAGERVMVDTSHRTPSPPGVYVIWDGVGLILKRLEFLVNSKPPIVKLKSINPDYETYEKPLEEVIINGRVIGKWTWK